MVKVSVMYPNTAGARFDHTYYRDKHMPLVKARMGDTCRYYTVDKGIAGGAPGAPATYVGMCHIYCDSVEAFQAGFGPHAKEIMADIPDYADQSPVIQINEVVVGSSDAGRFERLLLAGQRDARRSASLTTQRPRTIDTDRP